MSSVVYQIEDQSGVGDRRYGRSLRMVQVLDVVLPNSHTAEMCEAFASRVRNWGRFARASQCVRTGWQPPTTWIAEGGA
jgi:hypothetical protein